ncbi:hypothetical protein SERLA73DRAFT_73962 [Serpula lacrymans var. lacrymans S7.3]|uniref:Uncharacterized protein n=2 Tax=Serpula lacrymans var. lacrymans TaxID=341189 RepID=F8PX61_SERL3|nr:uncharacterized protein SERLADRAFT_438593 [Serpula lacrymans var. lacrymans S7.9]EGN99440.1 hypothetical protein SERLA73DRAFT_73962 [Serpula lacrymans var. lacrymans S7.3]EGO24996.1 hypothetical protein SERLADRAFT_438593 [Serpula lacrymans var. lacrymans S7.9]
MSTSNSTGFPITTYSIPGDANLLADERVSFARGQRHNQANITDAIELILNTFVGKRAFAAQQSGLEYLSGTPDGKVSFGIFVGMTLEDELLKWADRLGKGIFGIRREDIAKQNLHADRARRLYKYSSTWFVPPVLVAPRPDQCYPRAHLPHHHPSTYAHPVGGKIYSHHPNQPDLTRVEPLQSPFHWVKPKTTISRQEVILQIPAAKTPSKWQSCMSKGQKDSLPGAMHRPETGSPSNPINVDDDAAMIDQLYAGMYNLGDDNPTTPQSNASSNTRQRYREGPTIAPTVTVVHRDIVSIDVPSAGKTRIGF